MKGERGRSGPPRRGVTDETSIYPTLRVSPPRDAALGELAESQHGVVTLGQLQLAGLTASAVRDRVKAGRLYRIHRGVYAVGHARLTAHGRIMAAVLACGPRAVASHRAAAGLLGLRQDNSAKVDVTVPRRSARQRPGVVAHATRTLRPADITHRHGIPCTSVARTALDLAEVVPRRQVERLLEQALMLRAFDLVEFDEVLAAANGRRGAAVVRGLLDDLQDEPGLTDSDHEERFLAICREAGLPEPEVNQWLRVDGDEPIKADFLWRGGRLIVEIDDWTSHGTRAGFERDRRRDGRARLAGWEPLRFTPRHLVRERRRVVDTVAAMLAR
jgi:very-short-patch-repair endonuclease